MSYSAGVDHDPAAIEAEIARTRASLDRKLHALEDRLNPRVRMSELTTKLDPRPYTVWAALAAVAVGAWMTLSGLRRYRFARRPGIGDIEIADMMGE
jgi:hypothetical protein